MGRYGEAVKVWLVRTIFRIILAILMGILA